MSRFFIDRPIFAWVLALVLMLAGGIEITQLPISQYPSIAPPQISISTTYAGASAQTVSNTVVRPILQQMSGLDGLEYIDATSQSDGVVAITLTFKQGTDPNIAQVQVQNKLSLAESTLPTEVTTEGINVKKATKNYMLFFALVSTNGSMTRADIADYIASNMQDQITRVPGVGDYTLFGSEYAMRIWMDPDKLYKYGLTVTDVVNAIEAQNVQIPAGELGGLPANPGQRLDATIIGPSEFTSPEQFENILLTVQTSGAQVRLSDVAKIELGPQSYSVSSLFNGLPTGAMGLKLTPGANQLDVEKAVKAELAILQKKTPPRAGAGLPLRHRALHHPLAGRGGKDADRSHRAGLRGDADLFAEFPRHPHSHHRRARGAARHVRCAGGTWLFHQHADHAGHGAGRRPAVDDAIVVVENVDRLMHDEGLSPKEASRKSMDEISGALIGIALVLAAVFLPMAFFGGSTGVIYRQFSVTIVSAMSLSVLTALIFTPALCATLLRPPEKGGMHDLRFFKWFNRGFDTTRKTYLGGVSRMTRSRRLYMVSFAAITIVMVFLFTRLPQGFLPDEDQGLLLAQVTMPSGATDEQTLAFNAKIQQYIAKSESKNVKSVFTAAGFSIAGPGAEPGLHGAADETLGRPHRGPARGCMPSPCG